MGRAIKVGIVDDHQLFLESLVKLLEDYPWCNVVLKALNGKDLQIKIAQVDELPEIMLVDVNMPFMDGEQTTIWLKQNYSNIKVVALSMENDNLNVIKMFKAGCCSYLLKDIHPDELEKALLAIKAKGFYNGDSNSINLGKVAVANVTIETIQLTETENKILTLLSTELTYKEIAAKLNTTTRAIEYARDQLYIKLKVQSRVGLCMEGIRHGFIKL